MELLEPYLKAVKFYLPRSQRQDIAREISEKIRAEIEEMEEGLGRPLTEAEQTAVLRAHGDPVVVAGRCRMNSWICVQHIRRWKHGRNVVAPTGLAGSKVWR